MVRLQYIPGRGLLVDGIPWSWTQVDQARRDSRACRESRGSPSRRASGFRLAPHCDCVCCQIDQLYRRRLTRAQLTNLELYDRGLLRADVPVPTLDGDC
jgi:hypothetical protein